MSRMLEIAYQEMGVHEVDGPDANPRIMEYFAACGATWIKDDVTPWCGARQGFLAKQAGYPLPPEPLRAISWEDWGQPCEPQRGCVVVLKRRDPSNPTARHVGLLDRIDAANGLVYVNGGNQSNTSSIAAYKLADVTAFRWPEGESRGAAMQDAAEGVSIYQIVDRVRKAATVVGVGGGGSAAAAKQAGVKVTAFDGLLSFAGDNWALILIVCCLLVYCVTEIVKDKIKTDVRSGAILPPAPSMPEPTTV